MIPGDGGHPVETHRAGGCASARLPPPPLPVWPASRAASRGGDATKTGHYRLRRTARHPSQPMRTDTALLIRPSTSADLDAITAIYADAVLHGTGTFELEAPGRDEIARRRDDVTAKGLPWLVAQRHERVLGFAYANLFRPRRAYRFCLEDSVYVGADARGGGVGKLLLTELLGRCEARGARQMLAVIGDAANAASIGVHAALGFVRTGVLKSVGWKTGRWLDVVVMQRALGSGDATTPALDR